MSSSENSKECNPAALKHWQAQTTATSDHEDDVAGEPFPSGRPQVPLLQKLAQGVQKAASEWKPVAYASQSMSETKR